MEKGLRIGQLAGRFSLNPRTIRYYEEMGLLPRPERTASGYRQYGEDDAARLEFIGKAKRLGLSLDEIKGVVALRLQGEDPCCQVTEILDRQIAELDRAVVELAAFRAELVNLREQAASRAPSGDGAVCVIIEHQGQGVAAPSAYLRGRGLGSAGRSPSSASP